MNKNMLFLVVAFVAVAAAGAAFYMKFDSNKIEGNVPEKTVVNTTKLSIAVLLAKKSAQPLEKVTVVVDTDDGKFAKGTVNYPDGGGVWFAAKNGDAWQLAYDGNGIIPCANATEFKLPIELAPQCIDTEKGNELVTRAIAGNDFKSAAYEIDGLKVNLADGIANDTASRGAKYFGNEVKGDFDNNGSEDVAFILTQDHGGTGTFYYAVAALNMDGEYVGTNGVFLGDRIAPQTSEFRDGEIIINYQDRKTSEPMTAVPSVAVTKYLKIEGGNLVEVIK